MKINELRSIIREVIAEEIANESVNKKQLAINEIKRIISENELTDEDLNEIEFLKKAGEIGKQGFERLMGGGKNIAKEFTLDGSYMKASPNKDKLNTGDLKRLTDGIKKVHPGMTDDQAKEAALIIYDSDALGAYVKGTYKSTFNKATNKFMFSSNLKVAVNPSA